MKKIVEKITLIACISVIFLLNTSCNNDLDIRNDYAFDLEIMPIQSKIMQQETVEIRCQLIREGIYEDAGYNIHYFQSGGTGTLKMDDGTQLEPNNSYRLPDDKFSLYYTSTCTEQQAFDIYITDNAGQVVQKTFTFQHENAPEEAPINYNFSMTSLPVLGQILLHDTIEIRCQLTKEDERNDATYSIRYFQSTGKGRLLFENDVLMQPNELYNLESETFRLRYISDCEERQSIDIYIVDSRGQVIQKSYSFENTYIEPEPEVDITFGFETLPVPKTIATDETIEIRCKMKKADERNDAAYYIRYFQPDGKGTLILDNGTTLLPNDLYPLSNQEFRLYYTSHDAIQQTIDIYIEDSHGQLTQQSFSFQHRPEEVVEEQEDFISPE